MVNLMILNHLVITCDSEMENPSVNSVVQNQDRNHHRIDIIRWIHDSEFPIVRINQTIITTDHVFRLNNNVTNHGWIDRNISGPRNHTCSSLSYVICWLVYKLWRNPKREICRLLNLLSFVTYSLIFFRPKSKRKCSNLEELLRLVSLFYAGDEVLTVFVR